MVKNVDSMDSYIPYEPLFAANRSIQSDEFLWAHNKDMKSSTALHTQVPNPTSDIHKSGVVQYDHSRFNKELGQSTQAKQISSAPQQESLTPEITSDSTLPPNTGGNKCTTNFPNKKALHQK
jgi:hypothetical protein